MLTLPEAIEQNSLATRKLQRIVLLIRFVKIDPPKARCILAQFLSRQEYQPGLALDVAIECKLCSREQANGDIGIIDRSETASQRICKSGRYKPVACSRGAAVEMLQAVVAHVDPPIGLLRRVGELQVSAEAENANNANTDVRSEL